ncbi:MAG TPA: hypothetical protein VLF89_07120 [Candidatus Saccharimonadales bacterium]|nr:hypothetical protein [Candidatus Saccharimonadales bacterium]
MSHENPSTRSSSQENLLPHRSYTFYDLNYIITQNMKSSLDVEADPHAALESKYSILTQNDVETLGSNLADYQKTLYPSLSRHLPIFFDHDSIPGSKSTVSQTLEYAYNYLSINTFKFRGFTSHIRKCNPITYPINQSFESNHPVEEEDVLAQAAGLWIDIEATLMQNGNSDLKRYYPETNIQVLLESFLTSYYGSYEGDSQIPFDWQLLSHFYLTSKAIQRYNTASSDSDKYNFDMLARIHSTELQRSFQIDSPLYKMIMKQPAYAVVFPVLTGDILRNKQDLKILFAKEKKGMTPIGGSVEYIDFIGAKKEWEVFYNAAKREENKEVGDILPSKLQMLSPHIFQNKPDTKDMREGTARMYAFVQEVHSSLPHYEDLLDIVPTEKAKEEGIEALIWASPLEFIKHPKYRSYLLKLPVWLDEIRYNHYLENFVSDILINNHPLIPQRKIEYLFHEDLIQKSYREIENFLNNDKYEIAKQTVLEFIQETFSSSPQELEFINAVIEYEHLHHGEVQKKLHKRTPHENHVLQTLYLALQISKQEQLLNYRFHPLLSAFREEHTPIFAIAGILGHDLLEDAVPKNHGDEYKVKNGKIIYPQKNYDKYSKDFIGDLKQHLLEELPNQKENIETLSIFMSNFLPYVSNKLFGKNIPQQYKDFWVEEISKYEDPNYRAYLSFLKIVDTCTNYISFAKNEKNAKKQNTYLKRRTVFGFISDPIINNNTSDQLQVLQNYHMTYLFYKYARQRLINSREINNAIEIALKKMDKKEKQRQIYPNPEASEETNQAINPNQ